MLAAKNSLAKKNSDNQILQWKRELVEQLSKSNYPTQKVKEILNFIRYCVTFKDSKVVEEFEEQVSNIFNTRSSMGIHEAIIAEVTQKGKQEGIKEGLKKGIKEGIKEGVHFKSIQMAENCLKEGMDMNLIAKLTELPLSTIQDVAHKRST
jgi:predicted transposase YdaD